MASTMELLHSQKIAFIGGGNMASAIISGLLSTSFPASQITVSEPWEVNREKISAMGVNNTSNNLEALVGSGEGGKKVVDFIFLAVKPQVAKVVCKEIGEFFAGNGGEGEGGSSSSSSSSSSLPVLVSIAAGITAESIRGWIVEGGKEKGKEGGSLPVVRVMPNTPALLGEGASGLYAGEDVSAQQKELVTALLKSVSRVVEWVDREELLDVVTGLSGSGPAYFFALVEHLITSSVRLGLSESQATRLATQTCFGAGKMLVESTSAGKESPAQLRKNVTSPNGTTQAALESFEASRLAEIVDRAVKAAADRGEELGRTLGGQ
ncbi:pyrroline-5-carboxylate reductase [Sphaerulina musiva SO2202]|uniref:Pyrroline-5-carboxylate reductase n=1 Tax=Sphaerulina musiva (strain SO2202) TaxID=692275 RepID=M3AY69_SPHMS|nr:pyrroline-5-carboxylate reductase [Sphaerulina musiva SO2202]EMF12432.1 pyrroline-5-carboxylate reductase [Sphaerulina musiva SO2202]